jgi:hypothetical protein
MIGQSKKVQRVCQVCRKTFLHYPAPSFGPNRGKFCSIDCRQASQRVPTEQRFWNYVEKTETCWLWTGLKGSEGYGNLRHKGRMEKAHRVAWMLTRGPIPAGMLVCHHCDNPSCVNPDHLFTGTNADNAADKARKHRAQHGEAVHTSKLDEQKVRQIRALYEQGQGPREIAKRFEVNRRTIHRIVSGQIWRHVE